MQTRPYSHIKRYNKNKKWLDMVRLRYLLLFIGIFFIQSVEAQNNQKWYWAYRTTDRSVVAYTAEGNTNTLLKDVYAANLYRIDSQTAVVMIEQNHEASAYILIPTAAYHIATLYPSNYVEACGMTCPPGVEALALLYPYILIWNHELTPPLLFNRQTLEVEPLEISGWDKLQISANGRYLRYFISDKKEDQRTIYWRLAEYDIIERKERTFFFRDKKVSPRIESIYEMCKPDQYGEKWFCVQTFSVYTALLDKQEIIHLNGQREVIPADHHLKVGLNGEWYLLVKETYHFPCDNACTFDVITYATSEVKTYQLPPDMSFNLFEIQIFDENRLLLFSTSPDREVYYLGEDQTIVYLGVVPCCHIQHLSNDDLWRIFYDIRENEGETILFDLHLGRVAFRTDGIIDLIYFTSGGAQFGSNIFYSFQNNKVYEMRKGLYPGLVIDILPTGIVLGHWPESWGIPVGIYRATSQGRELLMPDAEPIYYPFDLALQ